MHTRRDVPYVLSVASARQPCEELRLATREDSVLALAVHAHWLRGQPERRRRRRRLSTRRVSGFKCLAAPHARRRHRRRHARRPPVSDTRVSLRELRELCLLQRGARERATAAHRPGKRPAGRAAGRGAGARVGGREVRAAEQPDDRPTTVEEAEADGVPVHVHVHVQCVLAVCTCSGQWAVGSGQWAVRSGQWACCMWHVCVCVCVVQVQCGACAVHVQ